MADRVGQQLGNYRLNHLLGEGGFAEVYLGEHVYLKTQAAIKVLQVRLTNDNLEDFLTEARTIASLKHPHIVRVLDFGVDGSTPFLVMDYASNGTLRQYHPRGSRVPLTNILTYVKQVATALQYAHDKKLIHRDVKPENMLLGLDNEVLLSDFGIAVVAQSTRYGSPQEVAGTIAYMAPEQIQGKPRPGSDQYALGVVVYEWLSGDRPFHGSFAEVASQHMFVPPAPLGEKVPAIAPDVERVVMTSLEKDPYRRFGSILAFAYALEQAGHGESPTFSSYSSTPSSPLTANTTFYGTQPGEAANTLAASPSLASSIPTDALASRRISRRKLIVGLAGLVVVGGGIVALVRSQEIPALSHDLNPTSTVISHAKATSNPNPTHTPASGSTPTHSPEPTPVVISPFIYRGHSDQVYTVAWSPNGARIASGGRGDIIQVWNASTGNQLFIYRGHANTYQGGPNWINSVAWSPDGTRIASGSGDRTVQVWNADDGNTLLTYRGHSDVVQALAWSPDSANIASASNDVTVQVWIAP